MSEAKPLIISKKKSNIVNFQPVNNRPLKNRHLCIEFNEQARKKFITGMHLRKKKRKKRALKEKLKKEKIARRHIKLQKRKELLEKLAFHEANGLVTPENAKQASSGIKESCIEIADSIVSINEIDLISGITNTLV